jgi:hypothetical protein
LRFIRVGSSRGGDIEQLGDHRLHGLGA